MDKAMLTAREADVVERAEQWIPRNLADLAQVNKKRALEMLLECGKELFAQEDAQVVEDKQDLAQQLRAAIGFGELERFAVVFVNQQKKIVGKKIYGECTKTRATLYPRLLFKDALDCGATGMYLGHNHPSGGLEPSRMDIDLTRKVKEIGASLEVTLIDHFVVSAEGTTSVMESACIF